MISQKRVSELIEQYDFIDVVKGFVLIKKYEEKGGKPEKGKALVKAGISEEKPYGFVIKRNDANKVILMDGDLVLYDENEGQELEKLGTTIIDDGLLIIPEESVLARFTIIEEKEQEIKKPKKKKE